MFARFDENPAMTLRVIKETKRYGRTDARTDNVKTVYPLQTKFAGGINSTSQSVTSNEGLDGVSKKSLIIKILATESPTIKYLPNSYFFAKLVNFRMCLIGNQNFFILIILGRKSLVRQTKKSLNIIILSKTLLINIKYGQKSLTDIPHPDPQ